MKIYLNLLPQQYKEEIEKKKIYKKILHQEIRLFFPLLLFWVVILGIVFSFKVQYNSLQASNHFRDTREENRKLKMFEDSFKETNTKLNLLSEINKKSIRWSEPMIELTRLVPAGVYLTSLVTSDYEIKVTGKTRTRDDLRFFQNKIIEAECFEMTEIPLQNLVVGNDADFELEFKVKKECLNK